METITSASTNSIEWTFWPQNSNTTSSYMCYLCSCWKNGAYISIWHNAFENCPKMYNKDNNNEKSWKYCPHCGNEL